MFKAALLLQSATPTILKSLHILTTLNIKKAMIYLKTNECLY